MSTELQGNLLQSEGRNDDLRQTGAVLECLTQESARFRNLIETIQSENLAASAELERLRARETELPAEIPTLRSRETEFRSEIIVRKQKTRNCWALKLLLIIPNLLWAKSDVCCERSRTNGNRTFSRKTDDWRRSIDSCPDMEIRNLDRLISSFNVSCSHQMIKLHQRSVSLQKSNCDDTDYSKHTGFSWPKLLFRLVRHDNLISIRDNDLMSLWLSLCSWSSSRFNHYVLMILIWTWSIQSDRFNYKNHSVLYCHCEISLRFLLSPVVFCYDSWHPQNHDHRPKLRKTSCSVKFWFFLSLVYTESFSTCLTIPLTKFADLELTCFLGSLDWTHISPFDEVVSRSSNLVVSMQGLDTVTCLQ